MGQFKTRLHYKHISLTRIQLTSPLVYVEDNGNTYYVPEGFKSDGFSIPKIFHWWHKPLEGNISPAILHDYILECPNIIMTFIEANNVFSEAMKSVGFGFFKRKTMEFATDINAITQFNNKPNNYDENQL